MAKSQVARIPHQIKLLSSGSPLPESCPPLNARVERGKLGDVLTFQTREGVSDTFTIEPG